MAAESTSRKQEVHPATVVLYGLSALLVGAIGSAQLSAAGVGGATVPFTRMLPVALVAEALAYSTIMLAHLGGRVSGASVLLGVLAGMLLRLLEAVVAAFVGPPAASPRFLSALGHYWAEYWLGVIVQVAVTALFLWLIRGCFELPQVVLVAPQSDVPDMEPERLRAFHQENQRRRELIGELMRHPETEQPAPQEPAPAPPVLHPQLALVPQEPVAQDEPAPVATTPEPASIAEEAPVPEEEEAEAPPPAETPAEPAQESPLVLEPPAAGPPPLTPQQSVIMALREEDEEVTEDAYVATHRPEPGRHLAEAVAAPGVAPAVPPPSPALRQTLSLVTEGVGAGPAVLARSPQGRSIALAAGGPAALDAVLRGADRLWDATAALSKPLNVGQPARVLLRSPDGYLGAALIAGEGTGALAILALPQTANLGVANQVLSRLTALSPDSPLPAWPEPKPLEVAPAYPDPDLEGRLLPLLEWVPEAAGLHTAAASSGGRQLLVMSEGAPAPLEAVALTAAAHEAADGLCASLGKQACEVAVWSATAGSVVSASATVAGQRLIVALLSPGDPAGGRANIRLGQILNGLHRFADGSGGE